MIRVAHLTKIFGAVTAVDDLTFDVTPGVVTGFLGPNGSGKSTTMRLVLGLDRPTRGTATVNGQPYSALHSPLREVGTLLDAGAFDSSRSARNNLRVLAAANGIADSRVDEVLSVAGIHEVGHRRVGTFSLGMRQRLGVAAALLGDPPIVICDEPVNGLDPEGIRWIRTLFRQLADEGRTVWVSSHLMSEMAVTADEVIVIGRGRFLTRGRIDELTSANSLETLVRSPETARLRQILSQNAATVAEQSDGSLLIHGLTSEEVGRLALENHILVSELTPQRASLEEVFLDLTKDETPFGAKEMS